MRARSKLAFEFEFAVIKRVRKQKVEAAALPGMAGQGAVSFCIDLVD